MALFTLSLLSVLCLSGCKKDEVLDKPVDFGTLTETESTTSDFGVSVDTKNEFSVKTNQQDVFQYEPVYIEEENVYDSEELSQDEIDAYYNVVVDPITGEDVSFTASLSELQSDALNIYKPLYESKELSKEDIETTINIVYADLPQEDRDKVLSEIFDSNKEIEITETEAAVVEETMSDDEFRALIDSINASGVAVDDGSQGRGNEYAIGGGTSGSAGLPAMVAN